MKKLLIFAVGLFLGYQVESHTDLYAVSCNPAKYGYMYVPASTLENEEFGCLHNPSKTIRITQLDVKAKWIGSYIHLWVYELTGKRF